MDKDTLIKELKKIPGNPEVEVKFSFFNCTGHGPDEYCYCGNEERQEGITYLVEEKNDKQGKKLKEPKIVVYLS
jgi:hypothetical protein